MRAVASRRHSPKPRRTCPLWTRRRRIAQGIRMNANTRKAASRPKLAGYERCARSTTTTWLTQKPVLDSLSPVDLDPCVPPKMPWRTATRMLTVKEDGLATPWPKSAFVFHNPPYGKNQDAWMAKAAEHGNGVTLVMARFDTRWMHEHVLNHPATTALVSSRAA